MLSGEGAYTRSRPIVRDGTSRADHDTSETTRTSSVRTDSGTYVGTGDR